MIDLHLHLDGSLSKLDFIYLALKDGIELGNDFPNNIYVPSSCQSLEEYLMRFDLPLKLLQTKENLIFVTRSLISRLASMNYRYVEIRFAPLLHLKKGLTILDVVEAVNEGLVLALKENPSIMANIILCCMRQADFNDNMETILAAKRMKGTHIVAVDLAGPELFKPGTYYKALFLKAQEYGLNITIHAGEAGGSEEVIYAINNGAKRIGHGVHLSLDDATIDYVKKHDVCFEFCPTSNLQTKSLKSYKDVPIDGFLKAGIPFTINSDNMTVSNVTAISEMNIIKNTFNLSDEQIKCILKNSIDYSFATNEEKAKLYQYLLTI